MTPAVAGNCRFWAMGCAQARAINNSIEQVPETYGTKVQVGNKLLR